MTQSCTSSFILRYFNVTGRAEASRLLLTIAKVNWTEENPEWPQEKENQPFGRLPVLVEKSANNEADFVLSESHAIERYLGRLTGLLPSNLKEAARQEELQEQLGDIAEQFSRQIVEYEDLKKAAQESFNDLLDRMFRVHSKILRENGNNGHYFGDTLSFIDVMSYSFLNLFITYMEIYRSDIASVFQSRMTPEFVKLVAAVESDPLLESYIAQRGKIYHLVSQ
ncbi:transferase activity protein [Coemansia erecta]|uniref:Transferase activity protein n=1 Tax=Coemansia erecta TaxID=147472 RepID=A0A9W7Y4Y4_9FUNG|nr:transferase activity protein [Coemansia erecta]